MKKQLFLFAALMVIGLGFTANAQVKPKLKKQSISANAQSTPTTEVDGLQKAVNIKNSPVMKDRGDVYGPNYSDVVIDNWTGYYIDIYVDNSYRGTVSPWDKKQHGQYLGPQSYMPKQFLMTEVICTGDLLQLLLVTNTLGS